MKVALSEDAEKQYKRLSKNTQVKINRKLILLAQNPYSGKKLSGELDDFWVVRAWPYRIIYEMNEKAKRIEIHKVALYHIRRGASAIQALAKDFCLIAKRQET